MRTLLAALLAVPLLAAASSAQSLADAARQNRQEKAQTTSKAAKVFTSDDLSPTPESELAGQGMLDPSQTPDQWRHNILEEKKRVRYYQSQVDLLSTQQGFAASMEQSGNATQSAQAAQMTSFMAKTIERAELNLGKEKTKLDILQEGARKAGMPSTVYDPSSPTPVRFSHSNAGVLRDMHSQH